MARSLASIPDKYFFGGAALVGVVALVGLYLVLTNLKTVARGATSGVLGGVVDAAGGVITGAADVVSGGLNAGARAATGDPYDTFGTAWWKFWNPEAAAAEREITRSSYVDRPGSGATGAWSRPSGEWGE